MKLSMKIRLNHFCSSCFVRDGVEITGAKIIADKFDEYFTEIG